ncbi:Ig-like domain-containing protein [Streptomyces bambusae]|uniref:L,D-transpeptidase n=1 Tax=Streptomyces bambusae TaxID=1550616 RepID=UPI001CFE39F2|nr:Ig-like domain-containing protein [Streptomyces bambusae]MCB5165407.1 Ig-like domain-containing protein [Streptomyces bambusae]
MTRTRVRRARVWSATAAVTGALLVVAAAPGRAPGSGNSPGGQPDRGANAPVAVLVGRVLATDGGRAGSPAAAPCAVGAFRSGVCPGWRRQTVLATVGGAGRLLPEALPAGVPRTLLDHGAPTSAAGPFEIALARRGVLGEVTVRDGHGRHLGGELSADGQRWSATDPLRAGETYTVHVGAENGAGTPVGATMAFATAPAADDDRLTVSFGPRSGTYGAGQVLTADLSHPVPAADRDGRSRVERALRVTSEPRVEGSWHWVDAQTLHYRPRAYWPAHTVILVRSGLDGVEFGNGRHGGPSEPLRLVIGDRVEAVTDSAAHRMTVRRNGRLLRTLPVTTGKAGFRTRSGIKVVLRKEPKVRMRGDSVGIKRGTREFYDLKVYWATRVTWSGEYIHAAPWSVDAQGEENVSHGCTGMSTADAAWFFRTVREGDVVEVVNSGGAPMTPFGNGFGDWNLDWRSWLAGSALVGPPQLQTDTQVSAGPAAPVQPSAVRLQPRT